ncbi:MAG: transposase [Bacteroidetes bacterium]|nr:transposase [Bacteroidota bacterium]
MGSVLVCMEFTGIYNRPMLQFCTLKKIAVWMIMPIEIIRSMGIQRGKNDKIDSKKIAMYAILHHDKIKVWQPVSKNIVLLKGSSRITSEIDQGQQNIIATDK